MGARRDLQIWDALAPAPFDKAWVFLQTLLEDFNNLVTRYSVITLRAS